MKILFVYLLSFFSFVLADSTKPFVDLKNSTKDVCFTGLSDWQNAYGPFDADRAKRQVKQGIQITDHEMGQYALDLGNNRLNQKQQYEVAASIDHLATICDTYQIDNESNDKNFNALARYKCFEADGPEVIIITRSLSIDVNFSPKQTKTKEVCQGHKEKKHFFWESDAKKQEKKWKKIYSNKSTYKSYRVGYDGSTIKGYDVYIEYKHHNNDSHCNHSKTVKKTKQKEIKEILKEEWIEEPESYDNLLRDPQATFIQKQCLDATPSKTINGLLINRPCWKEQYAFLRKRNIQQISECDTWRNKNCKLIESTCVQGNENKCDLWELTFECINFSQLQYTDTFDQQLQATESVVPNTSFNEVIAKLSVFKEMKDEIANSKSLDPLTIEIFKGTKKQCSKSVASDIIYDCCFSYSGLAKQVGLAKCDADEIALASLQEEGLCHYIGMSEEKFLDTVTTNYVHVFCCFPTKLGRVLNEQARKQLHIGWGSPEEPNCQGLTIEQFQRINFDKINLEEVFEKDLENLSQRYTDKTTNLTDPQQAQQQIDAIKKSMTDKLKAIHED